jgi:hypothetical protein
VSVCDIAMGFKFWLKCFKRLKKKRQAKNLKENLFENILKNFKKISVDTRGKKYFFFMSYVYKHCSTRTVQDLLTN